MTEKKLKIVCTCWGELGHLIPMSYLAIALQTRGHEVHVITNHDGYKDGKASKIMTEMGITNQHYTNDTLKEPFNPIKGMLDDCNKVFFDEWTPLVTEMVKNLKPDLVITDFASRVGALAADQIGIPFVIQVPGPLEMMKCNGYLSVAHFKSDMASSCCGVVCLTQSCMGAWFRYYQRTVFKQKEVSEYYQNWNQQIVLINSYWGLDDAITIPPNWIMTGPLGPSIDSYANDLETKDLALFEWLNEALEKKQDVVYVSIGTLCKWQQWSITAIYNGLKNIGCRVIWSLAKEYSLPEENPNFWVSPWLPQKELLSHPAIKAGLCHCGYGGTLEFISAGVPIVAFPHFFDQPQNARLVVNKKAGIDLHNFGDYRTDMKQPNDLFTFPKPLFDEGKVQKVFTEVLTNQTYKHNMMKLQKLQNASSNIDFTIQTIENVASFGKEHYVDKQMIQKYESLSCCKYTMFKCFIFILLVTAIVLGFIFLEIKVKE